MILGRLLIYCGHHPLLYCGWYDSWVYESLGFEREFIPFACHGQGRLHVFALCGFLLFSAWIKDPYLFMASSLVLVYWWVFHWLMMDRVMDLTWHQLGTWSTFSFHGQVATSSWRGDHSKNPELTLILIFCSKPSFWVFFWHGVLLVELEVVCQQTVWQKVLMGHECIDGSGGLMVGYLLALGVHSLF